MSDNVLAHSRMERGRDELMMRMKRQCYITRCVHNLGMVLGLDEYTVWETTDMAQQMFASGSSIARALGFAYRRMHWMEGQL